jgi:rSAM/selenodomain-associated transferase 1
MDRWLIIFAKEPKKGKVKTRLTPYLSETECLNLYQAFLKDTLRYAKKVQCEKRVLAYQIAEGEPATLREISSLFLLHKQRGSDLGERMDNAFRFAHRRHASHTVIIGSDSPTLPHRYIDEAFIKLFTHDVVVGPSVDGGYYLIGLKSPCRALFKGIQWSSRTVLAATVHSARTLNMKVACLEQWYDVDDPRSLNQLKRDLKKEDIGTVTSWTRKCLGV